MIKRTTTSSSAAAQNPTTGDSSSAWPISVAFDQSTPDVPSCPRISALAMPTPMMEPISVCELDAGRPRYQVQMFQMIAEISSANTMAKPAPEPTLTTSSTGSKARIPNATSPLEIITPNRFQHPDQTTAIVGFKLWVYMTVATALAVS